MKKLGSMWLTMIVFVILLSACAPATYSPPTEIHLNPGDQMGQAVVALDDEGRSHIAGVVNDRIVYYRTRFGEKLVAFEMTMTGSGTDWKQYNPDIAVLDSGRAFVTWAEDKIAENAEKEEEALALEEAAEPPALEEGEAKVQETAAEVSEEK